MPRDFTHYLKREIIPYDPARLEELEAQGPDLEREWFDLRQRQDQGFGTPVAHITRDLRWPSSEIGEGDRIWLFAAIAYRRLWLPIGLDAVFVVNGVEDITEDGKVRRIFSAGPGSRWVNLADWTSWLQGLPILLSGSRPETLPIGRASLHGSLRTLRQLDPVAVPVLEERLAQVDAAGYEFISYRHKDGIPGAVALAQHLLSQGRAIWWDRWNLPRRLAEGREALPSDTLEREIFAKLAGATAVHGIVTEGYEEPGAFTLDERRAAGARFIAHSGDD